ncbi:MAG: Fic family protein [Acidobacteria bacterium]|nr:Fic family protein [Acidobacteriota bacterium]
MARLEERRWEGDPAGLARRDRRPCLYSVYLPDPLAGRRFVLDGDVAADVADAEAALVRLDATATALGGTEAFARLLLRAESVASSHIEGLEVGGRRLLRAETARRLGEANRDATALEVLGNIDAMAWGVEAVEPGGSITLEVLLEVHRRLVTGTRLAVHGGLVRTVQNWIGGSSYHPCSAEFVPPPPEAMDRLLSDLVSFLNDATLPTLAQAAIAHAQFETIHPFVDGNGRVGRALIPLILRRRGLGLRVFPPVSLILATWSRDYVAALTGTRHVGEADSAEALEGLNRWIALFAAACRRSTEDAGRFEAGVRAMQSSWRERVGTVRRDSSVHRLIDALPAAPMLTTTTAAQLIGRSFQATAHAVERLREAGVLVQVNVGRRNRAFEAPELIEAFTALERRLASPRGDTRVSAPVRRVPRRRVE